MWLSLCFSESLLIPTRIASYVVFGCGGVLRVLLGAVPEMLFSAFYCRLHLPHAVLAFGDLLSELILGLLCFGYCELPNLDLVVFCVLRIKLT